MKAHLMHTKIIIFYLLISLSGCAHQETAQVEKMKLVVGEGFPPNSVLAQTATELEKVSTLNPSQTSVLVQIVVGTSFPTQVTEVQEVFKILEKNFNEIHSSIKISFRLPENGQSMNLANAILWKQPPDIALGVGIGAVASINGEWLDLTPYVEKDHYDLSRFVGPTLKIHSSQPGVNDLPIFSSNAQKGIIGFPLIVYPSVIFYYPEYFDQAQVAYPPKEFGAPYADGDAWTYDKLVEVAQKLLAGANGPKLEYGWTHEYFEFAMEYAAKFGNEPSLGVSSDYKVAAFNTPMFRDALQWDMDTVWKWHIAPGLGVGDLFAQKSVAMAEFNSWYGSMLISGSYQDWEIAAVPQGPNGKIVSITDADMMGIFKVSQHPQEAWEVLKWLYEPEQLRPLVEVFVDLLLGVPEDVTLQKDLPSMLAKHHTKVDAQILIEALQYADLVNHEAWRPNLSAVMDVMELAHRQGMSDPEADIEAILEEADAEIQALLDEYWEEHK
jgi:multiple sugar transport system substrate-binding protein